MNRCSSLVAGGDIPATSIDQKVHHPVFDKLGTEREGRRIGFPAFRRGPTSMLIDSAAPAVAQRQLRHGNAAATTGIYGQVIGNRYMEAR